MASTGFKGPTDQNDNKIIPAFWTDEKELLVKYRDDKFAGDADLLASYGQESPASPEEIQKYRGFLMTLSPEQWKVGFRVPSQGVTSRLAILWQRFLKQKYKEIDKLNLAYTDLNQGFQQVPVPVEAWERPTWKAPTHQKWKDWVEFKTSLPAEFRIPIRETWMFQEYLRIKSKNRIENVAPELRLGAKAFGEIQYQPTNGNPLIAEFQAQIPQVLRGRTAEVLWRKNSNLPLPLLANDRDWVKEHEMAIRSEFSWRNYGYVIDYMAINGRALWNTIFFCSLAILVQLIVNPLAAYALSRFPMKATAKILLFLLATMAFPAEVAMIPSFLLLKNLHLLNTFAALVLPTAASGYTIYLLKGFFDSLPQEIFDSGQVDGAPEWIMMLKLAFPLSKPVLGYIALMAFMASYGAFIYAFLVCQDSRMWTLMVLVYQLQILAPKSVVMAAVTLAAIPTLIVFLASQKVIMRGIVLPGER